mmetsp:Transcript_19844/g.30569  ORF Transcript_19844/g.30569 Transcript_19844/m.30569 type:complete len:177 (+) Transcript_19844:476-1006(+)
MEFVSLSCKYFISDLQRKNETKLFIDENPGKEDLNLAFHLVYNQFNGIMAEESPEEESEYEPAVEPEEESIEIDEGEVNDHLEEDYPDAEVPSGAGDAEDSEDFEDSGDFEGEAEEVIPEEDYPESEAPAEGTAAEATTTPSYETGPMNTSNSSTEIVDDEYGSLPEVSGGARRRL